MLNELIPGTIWNAQYSLSFGPIKIKTRMTVIRLSNGTLWVHSPIEPSPELVDALQAIGPVGHVVAPNKSHHLFFKAFVRQYPSAKGYIAPGLDSKRAELADYDQLTGQQLWSPELQGYFIQGLPVINETVWFHADTGTLVVADLLFCFGPDNSKLTSLVASLLGVRGRLAMSKTMKIMIKDKDKLIGSIAPLMDLPIQRIVLAHDQIITENASDQFKQAFSWLD